MKLETRLSDKSWLAGDLDDEEDPFAAIDESFGLDEADSEIALDRDKHIRLVAVLNDLIEELQPSASDSLLRDVCNQLVRLSLSALSDMLSIIS